jgi:hypothetical protein
MTSLSGSGASSFTSGDSAESATDTRGSGSDATTGSDTSDTSGASAGDGDADSSDADSSESSAEGSSEATGGSGGDGDGGSDTSTTGDTTGGTSGGSGDPLDPDLDVPPGGNTPCSTPGSLNECGPLEVCRFFDSEEGRCESCTGCGNLNAFCTEGTDCDILFMCFQNTCTNFCTLGSSECGAVDACVNVGHPTKGVCQP